jgi:hypothetical protein
MQKQGKIDALQDVFEGILRENSALEEQNAMENAENGLENDFPKEQKGPEPIPFAPLILEPISHNFRSAESTPRDFEEELEVSRQDFSHETHPQIFLLGTSDRSCARGTLEDPAHTPPACVPLPVGGEFQGFLVEDPGNAGNSENFPHLQTPPEPGARHSGSQNGCHFPCGHL